MEHKRLPSFFIDSSTSDKYEGVADFFIAWTLRWAERTYREVNENVYNYLMEFLNIWTINSFIPLKHGNNVSRLILWIEVRIEGDETPYVIIIEDRYCSAITRKQLQKYKDISACVYKECKNTDINYVAIRIEPNDNKNDKKYVKNAVIPF
jgi:hypothetical protein